uniref:Uncharacterized protein n=1 Tax=Anguilla anguilla TaxID=7936 RepID=A0A0E9WYA6_ANGAN
MTCELSLVLFLASCRDVLWQAFHLYRITQEPALGTDVRLFSPQSQGSGLGS